MNEAFKNNLQQADARQNNKIKKIAVITEKIIKAPKIAMEKMFDAACRATAGYPLEKKQNKPKPERRNKTNMDLYTFSAISNSITKIPAHRWTRYTKKTKHESIEGFSALMEPALKVSIEKSEIIDRRNESTVPGTRILFVYRLEISDGRNVIFRSSEPNVTRLFEQIMEKADSFDKLPEEEKNKILTQTKEGMLKKLTS